MLFSVNDNVSASIDDNTIISENKNEILGIILDSKLLFEDHINKNPFSVLKKEKSYENICNIAIWLLSLGLNVS